MYRKVKEFITTSNIDPRLFIEDYDINNSEFLYLLDNYPDTHNYLITKYEYRIDLISKDIYGNEKYSWILLYLNRLSVDDLVRGTTIKYITLLDLNNIINKL